jgi:hypothetical protein
MRYAIYVVMISMVAGFAGEITLPSDFGQGWRADKPARHFRGKNLYGYINGGAELYLEFGFKNLIIKKYINGDNKLELELYQMINPDAALGIYLMKAGKEISIDNIGARNTANSYQILITKGEYFIQINNFSGDKNNQMAMISLSQKVLKQINTSERHNLFSYLPEEKMIPGTQLLFCGAYGLQAIYTFGKGDIFKLEGRIFGVAADYISEAGNTITRLIIPYPEEMDAILGYKNVIEHLDPYLKIIDKGENHFIFKDFQNKYGIVQIEKDLLKLTIHLVSLPE